jgi:hypothetical protein
MMDAWAAQLAVESHPQLGAALSDAVAGEVQEHFEDMAQQAKLYRAEIDRIANG